MGYIERLAGRGQPTSAVDAGVTDSVGQVARMIDSLDEDTVLGVDIAKIAQQALLIAGEDERLAILLVTTFRALLSRQLRAYVSTDGLIYPDVEDIDIIASSNGAAIACLQMISQWPGNPFGIDETEDGLLLTLEDRLADEFNRAAAMLGMEPTL